MIKLKDSAIREIAATHTVNSLEDQLIEEMAELTQSIIKIRRSQRGEKHLNESDCIYNIKEEIADVLVCINELFCKMDERVIIDINLIANLKVQRQIKRINNYIAVGDRVVITKLEDEDKNTNLEVGDTGVVTGESIINGDFETDVFFVTFDKELKVDYSNDNVNEDGSYQLYGYQLGVL